MSANPIDLVGGLTTSTSVIKADLVAWAKARVAQVLADVSEVNNTLLSGQAALFVKSTGVNYVQDTADTTTADNGLTCLVSSDGKRFKSTFGFGDYETRTLAVAAVIPAIVASIRVVRRATGSPLSRAVYIRGTSAGPDAFRDNAGTGNWWELDVTGPVVDIRWFGDTDAVSDTASIVQSAINAAAGKTLLVTGLWAVASGINVPNYTKIVGSGSVPVGNGFTIVSGVQLYNGIFNIFDDRRGGVVFDNLFMSGNSANTNTGGSAGAIFIAPSNLSTTDITDIEIKNCFFYSFNHNAWIRIEHAAQTNNLVNIRRVRIKDNLFLSVAGNATSGNANQFVYLHPNNALTAPTLTGSIFDVEFSGNTGYGLGVCSMIQGIGGIVDVIIAKNISFAMGNSCDAALTGYTYTVYQSGPTANVPQNIVIVGNVGDIHHNFAVYLAGVRKAAVTGNVFSGTFRPNAPASLPWGTAIGINGCSDVVVDGNALRDNYGGIVVLMSSVPNGLTLGVVVTCNLIVSSLNTLGSAAKPVTGIEYEGDTSVTVDQELLIGNNVVKLTGDTPQALRYSGGKMGPVSFVGNKFSSSYLGYNEAAAYTGSARFFSGNRYGGALANSPFIASTSSSVLNIQDDEADFSDVVAGSSSGFIVDATTGLSINGLTLRNKVNSGAAFSGIGAQGNLLQGVSCPGCATAVAASSIGLAAPNWTGYLGGYVQNLNISRGSGTTPSRHLKKGWIWDTSTTWSEDRTGLF